MNIDYRNQIMCQSENSEPSDSGALGCYAVLRKVHDPILESIFWLALGYALGWQDKEGIVCQHESDT
jgi:hypothetical protein